MKRLKWLAGVGAVLALLGGVFLVAGLRGSDTSAKAQSSADPVHVEDVIAQKSGLSLDTIHKLEAAGLAVAADKGTAQGVLTAGQAATIRGIAPGPILDRLLQATAKAAGASDAAIVSGLQQGQSLAQIAAASGVTRDTLKSNLAAALQTELTTDKTGGLITDPQIAMVTIAFAAQLDKIVDYVHQPGSR